VLAGAFQAWVKPEVDPPKVCALPRVVSWEGHRLAWPKLQPQSGVSGEHGRLGRAGAKRGLFIAEVAGAGAFHGRDDRAPLWRAEWWERGVVLAGAFQAWVKPEVDPPRVSARLARR